VVGVGAKWNRDSVRCAGLEEVRVEVFACPLVPPSAARGHLDRMLHSLALRMVGMPAHHDVAVGAEARGLREWVCEESFQHPPPLLAFPLSPPGVPFAEKYPGQRHADLLHSQMVCRMELVEREVSCQQKHPFGPTPWLLSPLLRALPSLQVSRHSNSSSSFPPYRSFVQTDHRYLLHRASP
jgi:hypothetical protein